MNNFDHIEEISALLNNITLNEMATLTAAKEIAHTLKTFTGRPEHLEFFIKSIDTFYARYYSATDESLNEFLFATICSKIINEAGDYLLCHPELTTWPLIKIHLRQKFGDKINRHTLTQQLNFLTRHKNESVLEFSDRLKILKNRITLKINSENLVSATKTALIEQTEQNAITVLLSNVNSELRTILLMKEPQDLDDTYNILLNHTLIEQQINQRTQMFRHNNTTQTFAHTRQNTLKTKPTDFQHNYSNNPHNSFAPKINNHYFQQNSQNTQRPSFPSQPVNIQPRPIQHKFPTNQQVFGKLTNAFPKNTQQPLDTPKPMSGVSIQPKRNFQRPSYQNNNTHQNTKPNFWRQNPHANPLVFTELTHLENNNTDEHTVTENMTQFDNNFDHPENETFESTYSDNFDYFHQNMYETFENSQPLEYFEYPSTSEMNENFQNSASQKDNLT